MILELVLMILRIAKAVIELVKLSKYTEPVSQRGLNYKRCGIDGNLDSTESGAGDYAICFVKNMSYDAVTSILKLHKSLVIEVSCEASRCAA